MNRSLAFFQGRGFLDTLGLLTMLALFVANAFHLQIYQTFVFYREAFGALFTLLILLYWVSGRNRRAGGVRVNRTLFYLLLFPVLLAIWALIDPGISLYGNTADNTTVQESDLAFYVLRNALLYLPMVVYAYLRGLNEREIRLIALVAAAVAPFSIAAYLESSNLGTLATLGILAEVGGAGVAYNSYVPYLTFSAVCSLYLLFSRTHVLIKLVLLPCLAIVCIFSILSTSRQSVLYLIVAVAAFLWFDKEWHRKRRLLNVAVVLGFGVVLFLYFVQGYSLADSFLSKFGSVQAFTVGSTTQERFAIGSEGFSLLHSWQWLIGAGLTSVITSGPHSDYIRWIQRVGVPMMIFGFVPFLITFRASLRMMFLTRSNNAFYIFMALVTGFTLFHSCFGYPREDANQAVAVYLSLALWFGAFSEGLIRVPAAKPLPSPAFGGGSSPESLRAFP